MSNSKKNLFYNQIYIYRYDIFSGIFMVFFILWFFEPILSDGYIIFSDLDFGINSKQYLKEIFGLWNEKWSTSTLLNIPRLLYILPFWLISISFGGDGALFLKSLILGIITISAGCAYLFIKRIVSIYFSKEFNFYKVFALITGSLFYAINPWVIFRIQHIYLLCGYSIFPLLLRLFFDIVDPKFQAQKIKGYKLSNTFLYWENIRDIFFFSLLYSISSAAIHYFFYGAIYFFMIGVLIVFKSILNNLKSGWKNLLKFITNIIIKLALMVLFFLLISFHWFGNYILSILLHTQASQHNINAVETLAMFSKNSDIKNVLYFMSYWWPMFDINKLNLGFYVGGGILLIIILYAVLSRLYKYHIVLFFTVSSAIFIIFSTGTKIEKTAPLFVSIVKKVPVIGPMFRDPNKLIGLLALGFALLLTIGVEKLLLQYKDSYSNFFIKGLFIFIVIVSLTLYIKPLQKEFVEGFYKPVSIPNEMKEVQNEFINTGDSFSRVLYLPIADNMTDAYTGVATPFWNKNPNLDGFSKATGDIHIYSSEKNTIFHHEGNIVGITYFINYLQHLLDNGLSRNIGKLIKAFPVNELAYHDEYKGQEERQDFNLEILSEQTNLKKHYAGDIYHLYSIEKPRKYMDIIKRKIYTPHGLSRLETYFGLDNFNFNDQAVIFTTQNSGKEHLYSVQAGDYIETETFDELFLSNLPEKYYHFPFESIESANIFSAWGKVLVKNNDWLWHLKSQGINNFPFDFDMGKGMVATMATSTLDVPFYRLDSLKGKVVTDFDTLLRTEKFFKPDNPQIFSIQANPRKDTNSIPVLKGEIIKGDPKNIWQVAKSGLLDAKENNPYQFNLIVSGRGSNKLHVKVRFFDKDLKEIGVTYVVAPKEEFIFDEMNFYGDYVSPPGTKYMRMDLLSFQNPMQKNYWWIHDVEIRDMEEYKIPNEFSMKIAEENHDPGILYARVFSSKAGGNISVKSDVDQFIVPTENQSESAFKWIKVGNIKSGSGRLTVENLKGFNCINALAFIPFKDFDNLKFPVNRAIKKANVFTALEAENSFSYNGEIQSKRSYPRLSGGKGIRSNNGVLTKDIDVLKTARYDILLNMEAFPVSKGELKLELLSETGQALFTKKINSLEFKKGSTDPETVIVKNTNSGSFPRKYLKIPDTLSYYNKKWLRDINLKKGRYKLKLNFDSNVDSLTEISDLHKFSTDYVEEKEFYEDVNLEEIYKEGYSECESISLDMMSDTKENDFMKIEYDPTCSADWYVYASKIFNATPNEEYLVNISARSENIRKRHMKVFFLNSKKEIIDVKYINDVPEDKKIDWNNYQQIVEAPENTEYMQFHIWTRGDKKEKGSLEIKNYYIIPVKEMILLDNLYILETRNKGFFNDEPINESLEYQRVDSMKRKVEINNPGNKELLITFGESPNPLWKESFEGERVDMVINGVSAAFITDKNGSGKIEIILRKFYYLGLLMFVISIVLFQIIKIHYRRHLNEKDKNSY